MNVDTLIDAIHTHGWCIWDDFLTPEQVSELRASIPANWQQSGIGRDMDYVQEARVRKDKIQWLAPEMGVPVQYYLQQMEDLRAAVNRHLYLGLFEYEAHFAKYEPGDFYKKHLDSFRGQSNRKLTTVFYLNDHWVAEDGGELVMYDLDDQHLAQVAPKAGRLVVFLSENFPHEVLPAHKRRYSIAGWYRVNGNTGDRLDVAR
ncbi:2OG-Fe(II) oxygenase [Photobacterium sp. TY1-4]|uniref:2OG-Fe(II) oxygenase n=1 Tax=Photobacterium sp. TY1-4 TaxID=2899122 RepID=UPI0021C24FEB|nr:2OG-Fe(II) oxygenase [Photobacterium sp. TY1-4]UXI03866.1 2OG-Fe(II) oxygenase [Photobacterium sp. TY1-4]